jgi:hypothetical protein
MFLKYKIIYEGFIINQISIDNITNSFIYLVKYIVNLKYDLIHLNSLNSFSGLSIF